MGRAQEPTVEDNEALIGRPFRRIWLACNDLRRHIFERQARELLRRKPAGIEPQVLEAGLAQRLLVVAAADLQPRVGADRLARLQAAFDLVAHAMAFGLRPYVQVR